MASSCQYSFYPVGLPKLDLRRCTVHMLTPSGNRSKKTLRLTSGGTGIHISELVDPTEVEVVSPHGKFRVVIDPANFKGNADEPIDLFELGRAQGAKAVRACALTALESRGVDAARRAELGFAVLAHTPAPKQFSAHPAVATLCGFDSGLRVAVDLTHEMLPSDGVTPEVIADMVELAFVATDTDPDWAELATLVVLLGELSHRIEPELAQWVEDTAPDSELSVMLLRALTASPDSGDRRLAASQNHPPAQLLRHLGSDPTDFVRWTTASNPSTPTDVVIALTRDEDLNVVRWAASNPALPVELLDALADHDEPDVRYAVADNWSTPRATLTRLARIDDIHRNYVATNPSADPVLLAEMGASDDPEVHWHVVLNLSTPPDTLATFASHPEMQIRSFVAENLSTPPDTLAVLATDVQPYVRKMVATNPNTQVEVLVALAADDDAGVVWHVARNPFTPTDVLEVLAGHHAPEVRERARLTLETLADAPA